MELLTEWLKPSGVKVLLNDEEQTVEYAKKEGWKRFSETGEGLAEAQAILAERERRAEAAVLAAKENGQIPPDAPRRGRPTKEA